MIKLRNKFSENWRYICLVCMSAFGLMSIIASGGGGGEGDDSGGFVDTTQPLALNDSNAVPVSGLTFSTSEGGITAGSLGNVVIQSPGSQSGSRFEFNFLRVTQDVFDRIQAIYRQGIPLTGKSRPVQVPPSVSCSGGGTITTNWTDADSDNELSVGDYGALYHNACNEQDLVLNGEVSVGVLELTGIPPTPPWTVKFRLNFNSLTASDGGSIVDVGGTLDVTISTPATGPVVFQATTEVSSGGGSTASSFLYFGEGDDFTNLTLYSISFQEATNGDFAVSTQGKLESSYIGGTVTFQTTLDITGNGFDVNNPSAGEVRIVGAANASVLLRILNSVNIALDVDDEGDGFDSGGDTTINSSWDAMETAVDAL